MVVGRDPSCDLVLTDPSVSGRHVQVRLTPSASLEFTDLNSRNGTSIDGHRVTERDDGPARSCGHRRLEHPVRHGIPGHAAGCASYSCTYLADQPVSPPDWSR